uniref:Uncharacterized protein n=1 Tax=Metapenaeus joyneri majanivirus TaxID=2984280 RepID=A0A9C7EYW3_9VIRU|nr:MAG: hypothetical protein [Metapenaeus joyneri majanivirus]
MTLEVTTAPKENRKNNKSKIKSTKTKKKTNTNPTKENINMNREKNNDHDNTENTVNMDTNNKDDIDNIYNNTEEKLNINDDTKKKLNMDDDTEEKLNIDGSEDNNYDNLNRNGNNNININNKKRNNSDNINNKISYKKLKHNGDEYNIINDYTDTDNRRRKRNIDNDPDNTLKKKKNNINEFSTHHANAIEIIDKLNKANSNSTVIDNHVNLFYSSSINNNEQKNYDNILHLKKRKKTQKDIVTKDDMTNILKASIFQFVDHMKKEYSSIDINDNVDDVVNNNNDYNNCIDNNIDNNNKDNDDKGNNKNKKLSYNFKRGSHKSQIFKQIAKTILGKSKQKQQQQHDDKQQPPPNLNDNHDNVNKIKKNQAILPGGSCESLELDIAYFSYMYFISSFPRGYIEILRKHIENYIINNDVLNNLKQNLNITQSENTTTDNNMLIIRLVDIILASITSSNNKQFSGVFRDDSNIQSFIENERERQITRSMNGKLKIVKPLSKQIFCDNIHRYLYYLKVFANKLNMSNEELFKIIFPPIDIDILHTENETIRKNGNNYIITNVVYYAINGYILDEE